MVLSRFRVCELLVLGASIQSKIVRPSHRSQSNVKGIILPSSSLQGIEELWKTPCDDLEKTIDWCKL